MTGMWQEGSTAFAERRDRPSGRHAAFEAILGRYCSRPDLLLPYLKGEPRRIEAVNAGEYLCRFHDVAEAFWLIISGAIRVEKASFMLTRGPGELVGEAAFYRSSSEGAATLLRGADMVADRDSRLFRIDRTFIHGLPIELRAIWHETMASVLTAKLDQATDERDELRKQRLVVDALVTRFVSTDGRQAILGAIDDHGVIGPVDPEACNAVVWFSDVAGFSAYSRNLAPADAGRLITRIMAVQEEVITQFGGQLDKHMGDGLMAFWRGPDEQRLSQAAQRSVQAAIACTEKLTRFFADADLPLDIRIGLHGGPVIFGDFGGGKRLAFTLLGSVVNEASRYEQAGKAGDGRSLGRLRVSPEVFRHISDGELRGLFDEEIRSFDDKHRVPFQAHVLKS